MRYVVTGASGQLGRSIVAQLGDQAMGLSRQTLDITNYRQAKQLLVSLGPTTIVNCAAYTKVDLAETERELCEEVNARAVEQLALICREMRCPLIHFSTDYVFGGDLTRRLPYQETDPPQPQSHYGRCKLRGEEFVLSHTGNLVIRSCGLFSVWENNFMRTIARLAKRQDSLRVVADQRCSPTYVGDLVRATLHLIRGGFSGLFHVVNAGDPTWYEVAVEIVRRLRSACRVEPTTTAEYGAAALRPQFSVLATEKYHATGGPLMVEWKRPLGRLLRSLSRGL